MKPKKIVEALNTLSNSESTTFLACRQKWKHQYVDGLSPLYESTPLIVGKAWHKFLELWMSDQAVDPEAIIDDEFKVARKSSFMEPEQLEDLEKQGAMVHGMMLAYQQVYAEDREKFEVIGTEKQGQFPISNDWTMYFTVDLLVRKRADKSVWIMEHKSASMIDRDYVLRLDLDTQISAYLYGVKAAWGMEPAGVIYNVTKKPGIRQKKTETRAAYLQRVVEEFQSAPSEYLYRANYQRSEESLRDYFRELSLLTGEMDRAKAMSFFPKNTKECFSKHGACPFLQLCAGNEGARDRFRVKHDDRYAALKK